MLKIHKAHEELVQTCDRREKLEKTARVRLQNENRRLQEQNRTLREQIDFFHSQALSRSPTSESSSLVGLRNELSKREVLISQLITQSKPFHLVIKSTTVFNRRLLQIKNKRLPKRDRRSN